MARIPHTHSPTLGGHALWRNKAVRPVHLWMSLVNPKWISVFLNLYFRTHHIFNILCGKMGSPTKYHVWGGDDVLLKSPCLVKCRKGKLSWPSPTTHHRPWEELQVDELRVFRDEDLAENSWQVHEVSPSLQGKQPTMFVASGKIWTFEWKLEY